MSIKTICAAKHIKQDSTIDVMCGDNNTMLIRLAVPIRADGIDLSDMTWTIKVENSDKVQDHHDPDNVQIDGDSIYVDWIVHGTATATVGLTQYQLEGTKIENELCWQSRKLFLNVHGSIDPIQSSMRTKR